MKLGFCSLASGSSGNCYLIKSDNTNLLLDAGISCKAIQAGLESLGISLKDIDGIFITHDHIDHIKGIKTLLKKTSCPLYASRGTLEALVEKISPLPYERLIEVVTDEEIGVGDIKAMPFDLSHDTEEPKTFTFTKDGAKVCVVTDTGYVSDDIFDNIKDADILALESNHERNILLYGSYPYSLKLRILSDVGHLSNEACAHCLTEVLRYRRIRKRFSEDGGVLKVFLAHLSKENNTPEQALITVRNALEEEGFIVGKDLELKVLSRDERSGFFTV
ncbi:MAG: MBL fold metallo-hydrolase [Firmicutes bacterium]|nr:MBL fold metallo-hydrolase [Clostridiales bacterium]MBQ5954893.1 MBL fold metallo-hydrolase [Bacillota bacterium]MBR3183171.1 MBL fold metallo-hydrolase [Bacillota bacterium]MBR3260997.1 MBL fold metallo-hydrolase [Bacillota bacterium]MBR3376044.1 MBL fold metallo-hydrolase [Bacillota bacterium]